jgi:hypothetical protein
MRIEGALILRFDQGESLLHVGTVGERVIGEGEEASETEEKKDKWKGNARHALLSRNGMSL